MVMHHGAYSQGISIKKIVCLFFGINQYWACRVDLLFANSPVRANILNPDQTARKKKWVITVLYVIHLSLSNVSFKKINVLVICQASKISSLQTL